MNCVNAVSLIHCHNTNNGDDYMIPIKIETLLEGRKVEQNRIEYKEGFRSEERRVGKECRL